MTTTVASVMVNPKGATSLRKGNPWCYRSEVVSWPKGLPPGTVVDVVDTQKNPIGQAFAATASPLALRLLTRKPSSVETIDEAFFLGRLKAALERRRSVASREAYRLVHAEADLLPGLFVDRYGDALTVQTLSEGAEVRKAGWAKVLKELTGARVVVCRDDASGRDFEKLPRETSVLAGSGKTTVRYHEGELELTTDLLADAKTGSFLDQVDNHLRAGELASGTALDTFSYHGGFALQLAKRCSSVIAVEQDEAAVARAQANIAANKLTNVQVQHANAFDVLHELSNTGQHFDTVIIDPPGLAKRREGLKVARAAYHELNLRALKLVAPEGLLVTCSCSGKVSRSLFEEIVLSAAADAKRRVQVLERRSAGVDHPELGGLPETGYLKAWFLRVL